MTLEGLNRFDQEFISLIVDNYVLVYKNINEYPDFSEPGITVQNSLISYWEKPICSISLRNDNGRIKIVYVFDEKAIKANSEKDEYDNEVRYLRIKKSDTLHKITLLKWLYDSGYIFLIDDHSNDLFNTGHITDRDRENWKTNGLRFVEDTIDSKEIFDFISKYYSSSIIPAPQLIDLQEHKFETIEKRRFACSQRLSYIAIIVAIIIALASPFLMSKCSNTTINEEQYEAILKAISQSNSEVKISDSQVDTIIRAINN